MPPMESKTPFNATKHANATLLKRKVVVSVELHARIVAQVIDVHEVVNGKRVYHTGTYTNTHPVMRLLWLGDGFTRWIKAFDDVCSLGYRGTECRDAVGLRYACLARCLAS